MTRNGSTGLGQAASGLRVVNTVEVVEEKVLLVAVMVVVVVAVVYNGSDKIRDLLVLVAVTPCCWQQLLLFICVHRMNFGSGTSEVGEPHVLEEHCLRAIHYQRNLRFV